MPKFNLQYLQNPYYINIRRQQLPHTAVMGCFTPHCTYCFSFLDLSSLNRSLKQRFWVLSYLVCPTNIDLRAY